MLIRNNVRGQCCHMGVPSRYLPPKSQGIVLLGALVIVLQEEYCPYWEEGRHPKCPLHTNEPSPWVLLHVPSSIMGVLELS